MWSHVPIRDFIMWSSPTDAVSLLFFWCTAVKKEIPEKCGAAVANILRLKFRRHDAQPGTRIHQLDVLGFIREEKWPGGLQL